MKTATPPSALSGTNPPAKNNLSAKLAVSKRPHSISFLDDKGLPQKSVVQHHHQKDCDINTIMKKYTQTGLLPASAKTPQYLDLSKSITYQESLNLVITARNQFDALPAELRSFFDNDPAELLLWAEGKTQNEINEKLGLLPEPEAKAEAPEAVAPEKTPTPEEKPAESAEKPD